VDIDLQMLMRSFNFIQGHIRSFSILTFGELHQTTRAFAIQSASLTPEQCKQRRNWSGGHDATR